MKEELLAGLMNNPYFSAGFGLVGVGAGLGLLRQGAIHGVTLAKRHLLVTLEIPSKDFSYSWFLQWMSSRGNTPKSGHQLSVQTSFIQHDNGSTFTKFRLIPGPGRHYFQYRGAWIQVERTREKQMTNMQSGTPWESVVLTTLSRDRTILERLLEEAKELALECEEGKTVIYTSYGPEWRPFGNPRKRRPFESVVLDQNISHRILKDVKKFMTNGKWYYERGIPYRRGYLLYGPPGSGKTSYIQALAGELGYNICLMNLSERGMTDDRLAHLLSNTPPRCLILLEDIDAAFSQRQQSDAQGYQSMVTFSGLLNALDGVASAEERIIFMTTNHKERLDPALIRPGRVDMQEYFGNATPEQAEKLFLKFFPQEHQKALEFVQLFAKLEQQRSHEQTSLHQASKSVSPAMLQGHFVIYSDDPQKSIDNLARLF
ncbi:BCS1 N terminal-domain-containing protein [Polychytrium aggregatum]|uniref:BCS1 N terminal-domain-containing protein n=1 Tax=Polychytrium aggregatum TaxID=110093 RepID=UPI0022FDDBCD|nr:BCS1 N terminal-domain-containing protein [Polychytrium aggregatum]KAI9199490.1 BCS1 N terminal-domain-containing protein [Polychytrium aggregatum]